MSNILLQRREGSEFFGEDAKGDVRFTRYDLRFGDWCVNGSKKNMGGSDGIVCIFEAEKRKRVFLLWNIKHNDNEWIVNLLHWHRLSATANEIASLSCKES